MTSVRFCWLPVFICRREPRAEPKAVQKFDEVRPVASARPTYEKTETGLP